jgi:hypothetical protein
MNVNLDCFSMPVLGSVIAINSNTLPAEKRYVESDICYMYYGLKIEFSLYSIL